MTGRSEKSREYLKLCIDEIKYHIDEKESALKNRQLLNICRKFTKTFNEEIDPHIYHELGETAVNLLIKNKYAKKLLYASRPEMVIKEILKPLTERLPTQTWRSNKQIIRQQFSTPPTIAYLISYLLNFQINEAVLEPSAGTGSLAIWSSGSGLETYTNEIDERRRELLDCLNLLPTSFNAELINDFLPAAIKPDVLLMNPPFSSNGGRTMKNSSKFGFRHVESALERLKKGGKFGVILGEAGGLNTKTGNDFWRELSERIEVKAIIKIDGREYYKNGTAVDINLIIGKKFKEPQKIDWSQVRHKIINIAAATTEEAFDKALNLNLRLKQ